MQICRFMEACYPQMQLFSLCFYCIKCYVQNTELTYGSCRQAKKPYVTRSEIATEPYGRPDMRNEQSIIAVRQNVGRRSADCQRGVEVFPWNNRKGSQSFTSEAWNRV
jgi:hypothetical protein